MTPTPSEPIMTKHTDEEQRLSMAVSLITAEVERTEASMAKTTVLDPNPQVAMLHARQGQWVGAVRTVLSALQAAEARARTAEDTIALHDTMAGNVLFNLRQAGKGLEHDEAVRIFAHFQSNAKKGSDQ